MRERKLQQTRSINSSNGFDPRRLTAAINLRASLPLLPASRPTSHGGGQACVCVGERGTHTRPMTQRNRGRSNAVVAEKKELGSRDLHLSDCGCSNHSTPMFDFFSSSSGMDGAGHHRTVFFCFPQAPPPIFLDRFAFLQR